MKPNELITWFEKDIPGLGQLRLQAYRYGKGSARKVILMGMHGNELTPYFLVAHLLDHINPEGYSLDIIPAINTGGLITGQRMDPISGKNYNRLFQKNSVNSILNEIATALLNYVNGAEIVLDLHNWESPTVTFGMCFNYGGYHNTEYLRTYATLGVECILDVSHNAEFAGTMGAALSTLNYFPIEYPPQFLINDQFVPKFSNKLNQTLTGKFTEKAPLFFSYRKSVKTPVPGIFCSHVKPADTVKKDEIMGSIIDPLNGFEEHEIRCDFTGYVMYMENKRYVLANDCLFVLGQER